MLKKILQYVLILILIGSLAFNWILYSDGLKVKSQLDFSKTTISDQLKLVGELTVDINNIKKELEENVVIKYSNYLFVNNDNEILYSTNLKNSNPVKVNQVPIKGYGIVSQVPDGRFVVLIKNNKLYSFDKKDLSIKLIELTTQKPNTMFGYNVQLPPDGNSTAITTILFDKQECIDSPEGYNGCTHNTKFIQSGLYIYDLKSDKIYIAHDFSDAKSYPTLVNLNWSADSKKLYYSCDSDCTKDMKSLLSYDTVTKQREVLLDYADNTFNKGLFLNKNNSIIYHYSKADERTYLEIRNPGKTLSIDNGQFADIQAFITYSPKQTYFTYERCYKDLGSLGCLNVHRIVNTLDGSIKDMLNETEPLEISINFWISENQFIYTKRREVKDDFKTIQYLFNIDTKSSEKLTEFNNTTF